MARGRRLWCNDPDSRGTAEHPQKVNMLFLLVTTVAWAVKSLDNDGSML